MSIFFPSFFEGNEFFIDQKLRLLNFTNRYSVYNERGEQTGQVVQRMSSGLKFLSLILNKAMFPFKLEIRDTNDQVLVTIQRGWTFWMSKIKILDVSGTEIGYINQKFKLFKPTFRIHDADGTQIGLIQGDWKAWNFTITGPNGETIGTVTKKWAGALQELFTDADKYRVSIVPEYSENTNKVNIVSTAIVIDMVLKERK